MTNKTNRKWAAMCKKMSWGDPSSYEAAHHYHAWAKEQQEKLELERILATDWHYDPLTTN